MRVDFWNRLLDVIESTASIEYYVVLEFKILLFPLSYLFDASQTINFITKILKRGIRSAVCRVVVFDPSTESKTDNLLILLQLATS